jgi:hypothetical protein
MDCKINWTNRAWEIYKANIDYLIKILDTKRNNQIRFTSRQ